MRDELNSDIIDIMFKVFRTMKDTMSFNSKSSHLTMIQFESLICIKKNKGIHMRDLANNFGITMPTATSMVDKLIATDLAQRTNEPKDRRIVKISLTKQGEKVLEEAMRQRSNKINKFLSYLSKEDKKELLRIMLTVAEKAEIR
jgi:DNA-binding MarR family transcriptional regulator